jgi:hypothetical protein
MVPRHGTPRSASEVVPHVHPARHWDMVGDRALPPFALTLPPEEVERGVRVHAVAHGPNWLVLGGMCLLMRLVDEVSGCCRPTLAARS